MVLKREHIIKKLKAQINVNGHIIGVASGSGMTSKYSVMGGADFILALSAGRFRQMGRASLSCYLCYANSNNVVRNLATKELLPLKLGIPILFGLNASDPEIDLKEYIDSIQQDGFAGINNFPTIGLIDGQFREALEEEGITFDAEVKAIRIAHELDLFTLAFVFDQEQAEKMINAGADVICAHLGLTTGGILGAKKVQSLENARILAKEIFEVCDRMNPKLIKMVYGGPIKTPIDAQYFYDNTKCQGFIGGSSFERIPSEQAIFNITRAFKNSNFDTDNILVKVLSGEASSYDYVEFMKEYVNDHYGQPIYLSELALAAHVSQSYLSSKFKKEVGCSFTEYLIRFRTHKACELLIKSRSSVKRIAGIVGYEDYIQFCKTFKKYQSMTPTEYRNSKLMPHVDE